MEPTAFNSPKSQTEAVTRPMYQPHVPISENEMDPNLHHESPKSAKNTLLTLASLLVLVGIVGITLYLYIKNHEYKEKPGVVTEPKTTTIAVKTIDKNLTKVDLSGQKDAGNFIFSDYSSLTSIVIKNASLKSIPQLALLQTSLTRLELPDNEIRAIPTEIRNLTNLELLDLSNNKITSLTSSMADLKKLKYLYLTNNNLTQAPSELFGLKDLKELRLTGNPLTASDITLLKAKLPNTTIQF